MNLIYSATMKGEYELVKYKGDLGCSKLHGVGKLFYKHSHAQYV